MDEFEPRSGKAPPSTGMALSSEEKTQFINALSDNLYTKPRICKPILLRLDRSLASRGASYDETVSIEHVLPQTIDPGSEWAKLFPDETIRSEWTHRLANLVLLTSRINTRASNWDFAKKKKEYFASKDGSSPFVLTQGVLQTDTWTVDHLNTRQLNLVEVLKKVWQLGNAPAV